MTTAKKIGTITLNIDVMQCEYAGTSEDPPETWLGLGASRLTAHDLSDNDLEWMFDMPDNMLDDFTLPTSATSPVPTSE